MRRTRALAVVLSGLIAATGSVATGGIADASVSPARAEAAPAKAAPADLKSDLDAILRDSRLSGATVDLLVRNARTGEVLYDHGSDTSVTPASNNKIQTSTAAFGILGAGYRFRTSVYAKGGNLYLKGTGDPTMRATEYDALAAAVAAKGVTTVKGDLIADDTWFDAQRTGPDWDPSDFPFAYAAQVSALTISPDDVFDTGSIDVGVTPGQPGEPVHVALTPETNVVKIDNRAVTGAAGSASTLSINRSNGSDTIVVSGSYPADGAKVDSLRSVENPTLYAADVFRNALKAHGVAVSGTTERGRTPAPAKQLATRRSVPLSQLATPFLKLSNNGIAEILVKAIGRKKAGQGSWAAGLPQVVKYLKTVGVDTSQVTMTDGSGLSHTNHTTAHQLSNILKAVQTESWFPAWYNALPIAGQADPLVGGTLASRMQNTPAAGNVHAKTGTLTGATALSGYATDPNGTKLIFSSVFNDYSGGAPKDLEDRIAVRLASGTTTATTASFATRLTRPSSLECSWTGTC
jgi:D-alanyl-D-alanine carboxypeptidase/D-alanyl-D-alanine-endopeptidase (penicillin-binding protein 4)